MSARLVPLISGSAKPIAISRPALLVGRHPECDVRIDLPQISRRHCCLATAYDRITIRDLGSRHGVRVNGRVIEESRLTSGDEVAIGHLLYRFEDATPPPPPPPRADEARPVSKKPLLSDDDELPNLPINLAELEADDLVPLTED